VIPIFLIWIYTSWVLLLLGAHITFCLSTFRLAAEKGGRRGRDWCFEDAFRILALLWEAQKQGRALGFRQLRKLGMSLPQYQLDEIMEYLESANWVQKTGSGDWLLSRDMDDVTVLDLHHVIPRQLPLHLGEPGGGERLTPLQARLNEYRESLEGSLSLPLSRLLEEQQQN
jgi:membrane protein